MEGFNPLCGDEVVISMVVEDGKLADVKIGGSGCSISQSSASLMSAAVKGRPVGEVRQLINTFKGMMSIHEASLEHDGDRDGAEAPEPEEIDLDKLGELAALQGVVKFPVRIKCATLSWNALAQGLDEVAPKRPRPSRPPGASATAVTPGCKGPGRRRAARWSPACASWRGRARTGHRHGRRRDGRRELGSPDVSGGGWSA